MTTSYGGAPSEARGIIYCGHLWRGGIFSSIAIGWFELQIHSMHPCGYVMLCHELNPGSSKKGDVLLIA